MTVSVDGLKIFMKAVADAKPWNRDPIALRLPWNENAYALADHGNGNKLCFGMMWDDGVCRPQAPYTRAMEMTKKALEAAGHTGTFCSLISKRQGSSSPLVIDWKAEDHAEGSKIIAGNIFTCTLPLLIPYSTQYTTPMLVMTFNQFSSFPASRCWVGCKIPSLWNTQDAERRYQHESRSQTSRHIFLLATLSG